MTSPVDIVNLALVQIGNQRYVSSIDPSDGSTEGNSAAMLYLPKIQALLRAAPWGFARKQAFLTQLKAAVIDGEVSDDPPPQPWRFEYAYPSDCIKLRFIMPYIPQGSTGVPLTTAANISQPLWRGDAVRYQIATDVDADGNSRKVILCNVEQAQAVYTQDLSEEPDLWDADFVNAAAATLAVWLGQSLARDRGMLQDNIGIAMSIVNAARTNSANEQSISTTDHLPDWIQVRGLGSIEDSPLAFYGWDPLAWPGGQSL